MSVLCDDDLQRTSRDWWSCANWSTKRKRTETLIHPPTSSCREISAITWVLVIFDNIVFVQNMLHFI